MKKLFLSTLFAAFSVFGFSQTTWSVDPMHSSFNFNIKHMGISFVQGRFDKFDGKVVTTGDDLSDAKFDFTVDTNSVNTGVEMRDGHLKTPDFFDTAKFPEMKFVSTSMKKAKGNTYLLTGNLTIKDVTKPVTVTAMYGGKTKDQKGNDKMGFQTMFKINRLDYNLSYDPSGAGVAKDVDVAVYVEFVKSK
ncbi:MAG: YceI family protein [Weeksellaceae bacterium]|nr:YceI family protein [Weeksellaceae bacterium]